MKGEAYIIRKKDFGMTRKEQNVEEEGENERMKERRGE